MTLRTPDLLYPSQVKGINHLLRHPQSMTWMRMGKGKTVTTLTALTEMFNRAVIYGVLAIAPLRVIQTVWAKEAKLWSHTRHLDFSMCHQQSKRKFYQSLRPGHDIYLVNYDSLHTFCDAIVNIYLAQGKYPPFNAVVFDEVTMIKDHTSRRSKSIQRLLPYLPVRIGLTGTPAPNGYKDLFGQYFAIDNGERLGYTKESFEKQFMTADGYSMTLKSEEAGDLIKSRIADITYMMGEEDEAEDDLPPFIFNPIDIPLPPKVQKSYKELEDKMFLELDSGIQIEVANMASLYNKCLQAANGALYYETGNPDFQVLHDAKLNALSEIIEETNGPVLVMYSFIHDFKRIKEKFPHAEYFHSRMSEAEAVDLEERWNRGEVPLLVGHPKSMGHGLNLQYGSNVIVWYGLQWSLELFEQAIYRLRRPGQKYSVIVHMLMAMGTLDYAVYDALNNKASTQDELRNTINRYREGETHIDTFHNNWTA